MILSMMEYPFVILFSSYTFYYCLVNPVNDKKNIILCAFLAIMGTFSRADFGVVSISLLLISLYFYKKSSNKKEYRMHINSSMASLIGSVIGLLIIFVHSYLVTGYAIPDSIIIKKFWAEFTPSGIKAPLIQIFETIGISTFNFFNYEKSINKDLLRLFLLIIYLVSFYISLIHNNLYKSIFKNKIALSSILIISIYVILYANTSDVMSWYTASFFIPCLIIFSFALSDLKNIYFRTLICLILFLNIIFSYFPPYETQTFLYRAGFLMSTKLNLDKIAGWNVGSFSIGYNGPTINVDGKINHQVIPDIKSGNLACYIARENIIYIADKDEMFESEVMKQRGGYADGFLLNNLFLIEKIGPVNIYKINLAELKAISDCH
jgi:hypothetical protein